MLGYFSVSAKKSKRVFIKDNFKGLDTKYDNCVTDTIYGTGIIPGINIDVWVLIDLTNERPPVRFVTDKRECGDCTSRGTNIKPAFWN